MLHSEAETYHKRAWACLREANEDADEGRRAILTTAAITWETLAKHLEEREYRVIDEVASDEQDGDWLRVEIANARAASLARRY
jgi:hypothetical protein